MNSAERQPRSPITREEHPAAGRMVGRFCLQHALGSGGTGDVWLARDELLGRRVALKLPHAHLVANPGVRREFLREARAGSILEHPGIATIYDAGDSPCGPYIAMAYIDGPSLRHLVRGARTSIEQAVSWVVAAAEALAHAHARGVVHGDISPGNLMLDRDGRVKVVDFGLARTLATSGDSTHSDVHGTYPYMAPELFRGQVPDPRSDLYALGTVLYQLVTGELPFEGRTPALYVRNVLDGRLRDPRTFLPQVPGGLHAAILAALASRPDERPIGAGEFARVLRAALDVHAESTTRPAVEPDPAPGPAPKPAAVNGDVSRSSGDSATHTLFEARLLQAEAFLRRPDQDASIDAAIRALESLRALDPSHDMVLAALARASLFKGQLARDSAWEDRAARHVHLAHERAPDSPWVLLAKADLDRVQGRHAEALEGYARVLAADPASVEALVGRSWAHERRGEYDLAEEAARSAIAAAPEDWRGYSRLGGFLINRSAFDTAVEPWRRAVALAPDNARAWSSLGSALFQLDRFEDALSAFERSLRLQPTAVASVNAGTTLYYLGRYRESVDHYERALALTPADPRAWGNFGSVARVVPGMEDRALEAFARATVLMREHLERHPDDALGWAYLANWLAHGGQFDEARSALETALALAPSSVSGLPNLAGTYELLGEDDRAIDLYREGVERGAGLRHLESDPTLERLRSTPGWRRVVEAARVRARAASDPGPAPASGPAS